MQVILLDKIAKLGSVGEQVNVKSGYARNFLIPQGKAVPANKTNIKLFEARRNKIKAQITHELSTAQEIANKIDNLGPLTFISKTTKSGKLFGSIGARVITEYFNKLGIVISKKMVDLPNGILRTSGQHEIHIRLHPEVVLKLLINISSG